MWRKPRCRGDLPGHARGRCSVVVLQNLRSAPKAGKEGLPRESSCRLIKGLTGILQLRKLPGLFKSTHEASHCFASFDGFDGRGRLWPGRHANGGAAQARLVKPHSAPVFSRGRPTIQRSEAPWTLSRSPNHAADRKTV